MNDDQEWAKIRTGTNLEQGYLLNQRVVLEAVRLRGPISRSEIARLTGLASQTVFNITNALQRVGLVKNFGRKPAKPGKPPQLFEIDADAAYSLGLHLERDHITAVLVDFKGVIRARGYKALHLSTPDEALVGALALIRQLRREKSHRRIWGLGIALPGPVDFRNGKVSLAPNFPGWEQVNVQAYFHKKTGLRVLVDNDATAAAIGESWYGAARTLKSFFYVYVGVGVGGGIFIDGRPYRGFRGNSGEVGHIRVDPRKGAKPCGCGKRGCLEAYISLTSLCRHLQENGICDIELPQLVELFEARHEALMSWLNDAASRLAQTLRNLELLLDPEAFVVGGHLPMPLLTFLVKRCSQLLGVAEQPDGAAPAPAAAAAAATAAAATPQILQGALHDEAAALGASVLPAHELIAPNYESITSGSHLSLLELWDSVAPNPVPEW